MDLRTILLQSLQESNHKSPFQNLNEAADSAQFEAAAKAIFAILIGNTFSNVKYKNIRGYNIVEADVNFTSLFGKNASILWKEMTIKIDMGVEKSGALFGRVDLSWKHTNGGGNGYTIGQGISNGQSTYAWKAEDSIPPKALALAK